MDKEKVRAEIPYPIDLLFVNSAGSSLVPATVAETVYKYLEQERRWGGYYVAEQHKEQVDEFYRRAAELLGTQERNIAFAHDATDAYSKALSSIPWKAGDVLLTTSDDYASNQIQFLSLKRRFGIEVMRSRNLDNGDLDLDHFRHLIEAHTPKLVAVTHVPTNSGKVQDVESIGALCAEVGSLYLVDACQSVGQLVVDVKRIQCNFLTTTGRKFLRGPRGTGLMYVSDQALDKGLSPLMIDGFGAVWKSEFDYDVRDTAKRFEGWERPYALMMGLGEAIKYANDLGILHIEDTNQQIMGRLRSNFNVIPGVEMYDEGKETCNILTFRKEGHSLEQISEKLSQKKVIHSVSNKQWGVIDFANKDIDGAVRLSPHYFNTLEEMDLVAEIVDGI